MDFKKLQNGSDIRGVAMEGIEGEGVTLTQEASFAIGAAFCSWLSGRCGKDAAELKIALGRDSRLSGPDILKAAASGMAALGAEVLDCGLASTPAMFMACVFPETACDGAVMVTASHLPWNRNGMKFFTRDGGLDKADITEILKKASEIWEAASKEDTGLKNESGVGAADLKSCSLMELYAAHLRKLISAGVGKDTGEGIGLRETAERKSGPLSGLHIVVDAGNGAGGFFAKEVLEPLGADITGSQFLEPDGRFPNHQPNPENKEAMASISRAVSSAKADLGIIFDTDVDRSAAVDSLGREIARNDIVALAAALIADEHPGAAVVTDSVTSDELSDFLEGSKGTGGLGLRHLRYMRGYRNVINKAVELNKSGIDCQLAIETSGHAAYKENYFLDDGAYLAVKIVVRAALLKKEGKGIESLISGLKHPLEAKEYRLPIPKEHEDFRAFGNEVLERLRVWAAAGQVGKSQAGYLSIRPNSGERDIELVSPNYEGVRIAFGKGAGDGWALLRLSLHDPIMPLNIESREEGGCERIYGILKEAGVLGGLI